MRIRCWMVAFVGLVGFATTSSRVLAQSASVQAQSLFDEGRKLIQAGKIAEACAAFESSQRLDPVVTTLLNLAECREQNHQLATAWGAFVDANRLARTGNNDKLARVASNHAHKLEPRLSKLTISVPSDRQVTGLEVLRDKEPVNPASWNHALPIDGGTYVITARAPGRTPWSITRTIKVESDAQVIEIPKLIEAKPAVPPATVARTGDAAPVAASRTGSPSPPGGPAAPSPPGGPAAPSPTGGPAVAVSRPGGEGGTVPRPRSTSTAPASPAPATAEATAPAAPSAVDPPEAVRTRTLPIALGAGAVALGGTALAFHLWGNRIYDRAVAANNAQNANQARSLYDSANTRRYLAQGFGVAALGCAGGAVYLYVRSRGDRHADTAALTPVISPELAGLAVVGSW